MIATTVRHPGGAGQLIAHARAAGLVYAQHVVALHAPVRDDHLLSPWPQPAALTAASRAAQPCCWAGTCRCTPTCSCSPSSPEAPP